MLTLDNHRLTFSFPTIGQPVRALVGTGLDQLFADAMADNRQGAWASVRSDPAFRYCTEAEEKQAKAALLESDPVMLLERLNDHTSWHGPLSNALAPQMSVEFERTLRIPDDGRTYPLPAGVGGFPLRSVDDFAPRVPPAWLKRGGRPAADVWGRFALDRSPVGSSLGDRNP